MVAHVLRLRLALLVGALRGARTVRSVLGLLATAAATTVVCIAALSLIDAPAPVARTVIVLGSAAVFLGFLIGPVLAGTVDQLDPRRFAVFGVDERRMPWILALAALISVPSLALIAVGICVVVVALHLGAPVLLVVLMSVMGLLSTVLAARIGMAVNAMILPERRSRELTALFALAVIIIAFPVAVFLASQEWGGQVPAIVATATTITGFTPFGATTGLVFSVIQGDVSAAWLSGAVAAVTLLVLLALWAWLVRRMLTTTERPAAAARERSGLGWFAVLPSNAFGAIAARSLVYWLRDRRYIVNFVIVPVAAALTVLPLLVAGVPMSLAALLPVPIMALFFGWLPHNDVAYDSTALWTHVASGVSGTADRLGRLVPIFLVAAPALAVAIPITLSVIDEWHLLLPLVGLSASLFLGGLGVSSIVSVLSPYAVSHPGDSPFQQPQRSASSGSAGQATAFFGTIIVSIPTVWLFVLTIVEGSEHSLTTFWAGIGSGLAVLVLGALIGGRVFSRSGERLMEFVESA
ncbi:MAG: hypothetical protein ACQEW8_04595 [Actinomycetota bacterium]